MAGSAPDYERTPVDACHDGVIERKQVDPTARPLWDARLTETGGKRMSSKVMTRRCNCWPAILRWHERLHEREEQHV